MKTFKTLTLRNLDLEEKKDLTIIMNSVIDNAGHWESLGTGQSVIEHIIRKYDRQKKEALEKENQIKSLQNKMEEMERKNKEYLEYFRLQRLLSSF